MLVAEIQQYPKRPERGRVHRAAPLPPFYRFHPANDNPAPRRKFWTPVTVVTTLVVVALLVWFGATRI